MQTIHVSFHNKSILLRIASTFPHFHYMVTADRPNNTSTYSFIKGLTPGGI